MLADDFFKVAHHDVSGRPRLGQRAVALGLSAGLLGELLCARLVLLTGDGLIVVNAGWPRDVAGADLLSEVASEPVAQPLAVWLSYLADSAYTRVGERLRATGQVQPHRRWGRHVYVPVSMNDAALPAAVLSQKLRRDHPLQFPEVCLAGLVWATGLDAFLLDGADSDASTRLRSHVSQLWPPLRALVDETRAAVGNAVLAHRS